MFYHKMRGDYHRHFANCETGDAESEAAEDARVARARDTKARGVFEGQSSDLVAKIDALSSAIVALEKGRTEGSFLQGSVGAALQRAVMNSEKVSDSDRERVLSFLSVASCGGGRHAPHAGEIVGILKQLKVRMSTDLSGLKKEELDRVEDGHDIVHVSVVVKLTDEIDESASTSSRDNHVESNAFNPLDQAVEKVGHKLRSMCLIPTNKGGQAFESVGVLWLPREACSARNDGSVGKTQ